MTNQQGPDRFSKLRCQATARESRRQTWPTNFESGPHHQLHISMIDEP